MPASLTSPIVRALVVAAWAAVVLSQAHPALAQIPAADAAKPAVPPAVKDPLGRDTPAGMVAGFVDALGEQDYTRAAEYMDLSKDPTAWGPGLARQFQRVLDHGGYVYSRLVLSNNPLGDLNDGLKPDEEAFGSVRTDTGNVDLIATRVSKDNGAIWLISPQTLSQIPVFSQTVTASLLDNILPDNLRRSRIWGAPVGHWLVMFVLIFTSYGLALFLTLIAWAALMRSRVLKFAGARGERFQAMLETLLVPVRLLLAVWIYWITPILIGVSIVARQRLIQPLEVIGLIALAWLVSRVVDASAEYFIERMNRHGRMSILSAANFMKRAAKFAIIVLTVIVALDAIGFNVTTGLAALGIGGLAIALGAQKTVENLVGSLTLLADQPVRVGDFCKFGETTGTVEDIGMRSTRVRTNDRTLVTIPNGQLAAVQIENYSRRDKFWFHPVIDLRYETTHHQMRYVLSGIRDILRDHPKVDHEPARANFVSLGENSLRVEVFSFIHTTDNDQFLQIQEDLMLKIMEVVEAAGTGFAFPSRTVYFSRDTPVDPNKLLES